MIVWLVLGPPETSLETISSSPAAGFTSATIKVRLFV
jgi:hypothetical protein